MGDSITQRLSKLYGLSAATKRVDSMEDLAQNCNVENCVSATIEGLLWRWWILAAWTAFAALFIYPILKGMPIGLVPVLLGTAVAVGLKQLSPRRLARLTEFVYGSDSRNWLIRVCTLGVFCRLPVVLFPSSPVSDFACYYQAAQVLASGGTYPEIYFPPGQAAWLSIWIFLLGDNLRTLALVQNALVLLSIPLIYRAVQPFSPKGVRWACLVAAVYPSLVLISGTLAHETTEIFLLTACLSIFLLASKAKGLRAFLAWAALGCILGLAALVRPTFLVFPALTGLVLWFDKGRFWRITATVAVTLAFAGAVIAPWTARNYRRFGEFCLITANAGTILLEGNHPDSNGISMDSLRYIGAGLDQIPRNQLHLKLALEAIGNNPLRFLVLAVKRTIYLWGSDSSIMDFVLGFHPRGGERIKMAASAIVNSFWAWFVCAWAIGATWGAPWRCHHSSPEILSACWVALIFMVHAVFVTQTRFHLPLLPFMALIFMPRYWEWTVGKVNQRKGPGELANS